MNELSEKDFIKEPRQKNPVPLWLWFTILFGVMALFWIGGYWLSREKKETVSRGPFLQVTNRDFSLFLWQHTEYMRPHRKDKTGYLPGFKTGSMVNPELNKLDEWVVVPPEILFEYHAWKRLLGNNVIKRTVTPAELKEFLAYADEWMPQNWKKASPEYTKVVEELDTLTVDDLRHSLPKEVMQAFVGWKNYFKEGESIVDYQPDEETIKKFLSAYPKYQRNYWRNLYPKYLHENEMPAFLKAAIYNYKES